MFLYNLCSWHVISWEIGAVRCPKQLNLIKMSCTLDLFKRLFCSFDSIQNLLVLQGLAQFLPPAQICAWPFKFSLRSSPWHHLKALLPVLLWHLDMSAYTIFYSLTFKGRVLSLWLPIVPSLVLSTCGCSVVEVNQIDLPPFSSFSLWSYLGLKFALLLFISPVIVP